MRMSASISTVRYPYESSDNSLMMELRSKQTHFPFLALPTELRLLIFEYVLVNCGKYSSVFNNIYPLGHILKDTHSGLCLRCI